MPDVNNDVVWSNTRRISVVVDNESWILPWAEKLVTEINSTDDSASLVRKHDEMVSGDVAFYLGCVNITPADVLALNTYNLVVHASDLPKGKGFSPLTYQIIEGINKIPVCLLYAVQSVDSGNIVYKDWIEYQGHELLDELRVLLGDKTVELCHRFLSSKSPDLGYEQQGKDSFYERRRPIDSQLDSKLSIEENFNLLRTVDNDSYPAYFIHNGFKYKLKIEKITE